MNRVHLQWARTEFGLESSPIQWRLPGDRIFTGSIALVLRPAYCDRGRLLAMANLPLDAQEGWPRYYFDLERAKAEIGDWLAVREDVVK